MKRRLAATLVAAAAIAHAGGASPECCSPDNSIWVFSKAEVRQLTPGLSTMETWAAIGLCSNGEAGGFDYDPLNCAFWYLNYDNSVYFILKEAPGAVKNVPIAFDKASYEGLSSGPYFNIEDGSLWFTTYSHHLLKYVLDAGKLTMAFAINLADASNPESFVAHVEIDRSSGDVWVAREESLLQFSVEGKPLRTVTGFSYIEDIDFNEKEGSLWIADGWAGKVFKILPASLPMGKTAISTGNSLTVPLPTLEPFRLAANMYDNSVWIISHDADYKDQFLTKAKSSGAALPEVNIGSWWHNRAYGILPEDAKGSCLVWGANDPDSCTWITRYDTGTNQKETEDLYSNYVEAAFVPANDCAPAVKAWTDVQNYTAGQSVTLHLSATSCAGVDELSWQVTGPASFASIGAAPSSGCPSPFSKDVSLGSSLPPGVYAVTASAISCSGAICGADWSFTVAPAPPSVSVASAFTKCNPDQTPFALLSASAPAGIKKLEWRLFLGSSPYVPWQAVPAAQGAKKYAGGVKIAVASLPAGAYRIEARVTDSLGQTATSPFRRIDFSVDRFGPAVWIASQPSGFPYSKNFYAGAYAEKGVKTLRIVRTDAGGVSKIVFSYSAPQPFPKNYIMLPPLQLLVTSYGTMTSNGTLKAVMTGVDWNGATVTRTAEIPLSPSRL